MTPGKYTLASLEAMTDRELDATVARVVFGETVNQVEFPGGATEWVMEQAVVPCYTGEWKDHRGLMNQMSMLEYAWFMICRREGLFGTSRQLVHSVRFTKGQVEVELRYDPGFWPLSQFRAAAIAAVLAVQGAAS